MDSSVSPTFDIAVWEDFMDGLFSIDYSNETDLTELEQEIYAALQKDPNRIQGLITLMFQQLMVGNRTRAKALAHKIWEIGGSLEPFFEMIYIENLLNLGLTDMASVLLKPRFENLRSGMEDFYSVMVKFAVMTGNLPLLGRISSYPEADNDRELYDFAARYQKSGYLDSFKNLQKLLLEFMGDNLCAYEFALDDTSSAPVLEITLYGNQDKMQLMRRQDELHNKITALWQSLGFIPQNDYAVLVKSIKSHAAWDGGPLQDDSPED